ncbi:HAD-IC family P-type ATPase [Virgisporangium aurantiacum]|uniref:Cation transporter E1-E2 family ATPase n=1 Tax=Virgisporangium aurantiacum TaxID=175570 RepID=A0A8J3ZLR4_9ACTN|nr:HAD-IC family P-type ATPase [Virgisporangium aurantiacum]GIJ64335.1 cation transporter E1-E2 family ATPase [Virgisporangium aurantiacum]
MSQVTAPVAGLSTAEAEAHRRRGEANTAVGGATRSVTAIVRTNVFSFFNVILFVIGVALLAMGRYSDAVISVGLGLLNAVISAAQEIRAKRKLDRLQLLDRADVLVVRDGQERAVGPEAVVRGDVLRVRAGDQIVVDGPLLDGVLTGGLDGGLNGGLYGGRVEADESLLTGESDPVVKNPGDELRSGSLCVAGEGYQLARDVGSHSYAGRLTAEARRATTDRTPLQRRIEFVVRLVIALTVLMSSAILAQAAIEGFTVLRIVQTTAVLSGLVPYGLFLLIAVAYTVGAASIARDGALVQQVNAVESVSNVDVVCTDKTGTLTTGRLTVHEVVPLRGHDVAEVEAALGSLAGNATTPNLTMLALAAELPHTDWQVREEVPFASSLRWSGMVTDAGTWVLGAPDALAPRLREPIAQAAVNERTRHGLRVLLLARAAGGDARLRDGAGTPALPAIEAVALVALADELRPDVPQTIERLCASGVTLKVLSGDDPGTVAAIATRAGLHVGEPVAGAQLDGLDDTDLDRVVARTVVFGRVAPEHKERVVRSLRRQNRYVAMIGDGVNDARALKSAQVGVAMRSGSSVTRDVADIVLVDDSFAALLPARREGRRIIGGIGLSMHIFLTRVASQGLVILTVTMLGLGFPYSPTQVGLTLLTVGVPTLFLTMWARPVPPDTRMLATLGRFVVPAALVTAGFGVAVYATLYQAITVGFGSGRTPTQVIDEFENYTGLTYGTDTDFATASATIGAQTGLSTFMCLASFVLILFLAPPSRLFAAWTHPTTDRRPVLLVAALVAVFAAVLFVPALYTYFGLAGPAAPVFVIVLPALALWFAALTAAFRLRLLERVLGLDDLPDTQRPFPAATDIP